MLVQIESNFNFKKRAIHLTRWSCYTVQSWKQDLNTFLCLYRAKEDNGCDVNEASNWHAANVLKASSFVLACERAVCVRSPYSLKSRGESQLIFIYWCLKALTHVMKFSEVWFLSCRGTDDKKGKLFLPAFRKDNGNLAMLWSLLQHRHI